MCAALGLAKHLLEFRSSLIISPNKTRLCINEFSACVQVLQHLINIEIGFFFMGFTLVEFFSTVFFLPLILHCRSPLTQLGSSATLQ